MEEAGRRVSNMYCDVRKTWLAIDGFEDEKTSWAKEWGWPRSDGKKERKEKIFFRRVLMHFKHIHIHIQHIQSCFKVSITWYGWRNGHIDKLNRIENYFSNAYGNLVCDKGDISIKYRGSYLCNKCTRLIGYISNKDQGKIVFMYHTTRNSKWVRDLNIKS